MNTQVNNRKKNNKENYKQKQSLREFAEFATDVDTGLLSFTTANLDVWTWYSLILIFILWITINHLVEMLLSLHEEAPGLWVWGRSFGGEY